jgi:hypothetical protein
MLAHEFYLLFIYTFTPRGPVLKKPVPGSFSRELEGRPRKGGGLSVSGFLLGKKKNKIGDKNLYITYIPLTLYPRRGSRGISDIPT